MSYYNSEPYKSIFDSKFYVPQSALSAPTSINTANQIAEVNARLNAGVFGVDISAISPDVANMIPKEHFKEIRRLTKLSGATASMHGPIIDLAGFTQQGYDEGSRKMAEQQMNSIIEKAYELNPEGNVTVNFHVNTQIPGEFMRKLSKEEMDSRKKEVEVLKSMVKYETNEKEKRLLQEDLDRLNRGEIMEAMGIVNQETGETGAIKYEARETPHGTVVYTPNERLMMQNRTNWDQARLKVFDMQKQKEERKRMMDEVLKSQRFNDLKKLEEGGIIHENELGEYHSYIQTANLMNAHIHEIDTNMNSLLTDMYNRAHKYLDKDFKIPIPDEKSGNMNIATVDKEKYFRSFKNNFEAIKSRDERLGVFMDFISHLPAPDLYVPTNKIAMEKTAETLASSALNAYDKFGEHAPIITVENYQPNLTLGNAEEIKKTIEESRSIFAEKLAKEKGMPKKDAMEMAEKIIGVTWDVGHINFLRSRGYGEEEILKQAKTIAPYVKQMHITDNFGFSDAHLPPGMGNVPMDKHIDIMKKAGFNIEGKEGKGRLIVETGEFVQQFKENPHLYTLEAFASPLYSIKAEPRWYSVRDMPGVYGMGLGNVYPEQHFQMYGSGFATLPRELGGQVGGEKSRFAGTPNA
ncbi:sugar phosphate isomerase/epimerase [Candidatus Woesearchaeota archaeon]|nr:sugar phosphate isomerase/epimerase [Candidatus Woesearchaeota archaeon]